jgi:hypothetical protein
MQAATFTLAFNMPFRVFHAHCIHSRKGAFMSANFLVLIAPGSFITGESFKNDSCPSIALDQIQEPIGRTSTATTEFEAQPRKPASI